MIHKNKAITFKTFSKHCKWRGTFCKHKTRTKDAQRAYWCRIIQCPVWGRLRTIEGKKRKPYRVHFKKLPKEGVGDA